MQVGSGGFLLFSVALGDEQNDLVFCESCFDRRQRRRTSHQKRDYDIGEYDNIPKGKDRNPVRRRDTLTIPLKNLWQG